MFVAYAIDAISNNISTSIALLYNLFNCKI